VTHALENKILYKSGSDVVKAGHIALSVAAR
jgi:hypothetical protein